MLQRILAAGLASAFVIGLSGSLALAQDPQPGLLPDEEMTSDGLTPQTMQQIDTMLADMDCEVDPSNVEVEDDGYELDDVFCADGQYDIELDSNLNETGRRKE
jgi:hypothetical protein